MPLTKAGAMSQTGGERRRRVLLDTTNLSEHSFGSTVFNLISNLPNEALTIFDHELVS